MAKLPPGAKPTYGDDARLPPSKGKNGGGGSGLLSAFLPGQKEALAQQLRGGFGGSPQKWSGLLGQMYSPVATAGQFQYGEGLNDPAAAPNPMEQLIGGVYENGDGGQPLPYRYGTNPGIVDPQAAIIAKLRAKLAKERGMA